MKDNLIGSNRKIMMILATSLIIILLAGCIPLNNTSSKVLTDPLWEPLGDITTAEFDIHAGTGNLTIDGLTGGEPVLANGTLQYLEGQGLPGRTVVTFNGHATITLESSGTQQTGFRLPWEACNGESEWQIQLNPGVQSDITARSDGGNIRLNLAGMAVTRVLADTGGGNVDVTLPDNAANLNVTAKTGGGIVTVEIGSGTTGSSSINASSGAGNVVLRLPGSLAARIHVTSGMGKVIVDALFSQVDEKTYQSPNYDSAADKVEIILNSGAGNVMVETK